MKVIDRDWPPRTRFIRAIWETTASWSKAVTARLRININEAIMSLRSVLSRSARARVGIVVGIGAVIAMVSTAQIVKQEALKQFRELGTDIVTVKRQYTRVRGRALNINLTDIHGLANSVSSIDSAAATVEGNTQIRYRGKVLGQQIAIGVTGAFFE